MSASQPHLLHMGFIGRCDKARFDAETQIMISPTPLADEKPPRDTVAEVEYLLRRADHESVAAIRALDPRVTERHAEMARHYSEQSRELLAQLDGEGSAAND